MARMRFISRLAPLILLLVAGCARPEATCKETSGLLQSSLSMAPRNGAQLGGMTIDAGGVSQGSGAPAAAGDAGYGLLRIYVILSAPGAGLSGEQSSALAGALDDARGRGVQAFVRAYYQTPLASKANAAQTVASIHTDIAALKSVLTPRLDAIPFIQAGFLGPWGEWWDGDLEGADFGTDQQLRTLKTGVVDALRSAFPQTFIQLRYPRDIATYYPDDPQIAFHDDSVLAGSDDGGTFNPTKKTALWPSGDTATQRTWIRERSVRLSSVNAGESSEQTPDVSCDELLAYLQEYRIFVFNAQWPAVVTKCSGQLKSELAWSGPLAPADGGGSGGAGGGGNGGGNGAGGSPPATGSELGCWATDQRPWQLCHPEGCEADRCRRTPTDLACTMYRAAACVGSWPPAGYPGEETLGTGGGGGAPSSGGKASAGGGPSSGGKVSSGGESATGGAPSSRGGGSMVSGGASSSPATPLTPTNGNGAQRHDCP
jgi:hypothetical protein